MLLFNKSEAWPTPIVIGWCAFSRTWSRIHVCALNSNLFVSFIFALLLLARCDQSTLLVMLRWSSATALSELSKLFCIVYRLHCGPIHRYSAFFPLHTSLSLAFGIQINLKAAPCNTKVSHGMLRRWTIRSTTKFFIQIFVHRLQFFLE